VGPRRGVRAAAQCRPRPLPGAQRLAAPKQAEIDEARLRVRLYLHEGLDLAASVAFWSEVAGIPPSQFLKPYRAVPDPTIRHTKHVHGCVSIDYSCSATHRSIMGLVVALCGGDAVDPG
jgi:hypothetical protein